MIDDALVLLSTHDSPDQMPDAADTEPLPSLLAQCEEVLEATAKAAPQLRLVHSFGPLAPSARQVLHACANLVLLDAPPMAGPVAGSGLTGMPDDRDRRLASQAALRSFMDSQSQKGLKLAVVIDDLQGHSDLIAPDDSEKLTALGVVFTSHPLRSYLLARHRSTLPFRHITLEIYAQKYLAFLERHGDIPWFPLERLTGTSQDARVALGAALRVPPPSDTFHHIPDMSETADASLLFFDDGSVATEEPLGSPAYLKLCTILEYDPEKLPHGKPDRTPGTAQTTPPSRLDLPPRRTDRSPSRLTGFLPRIARILDTTASTGHLPQFQLDTHALVACLEDCLGHPDGMLETLDRHLMQLQPRDGAMLRIACAAHFQACNQAIHVLSLLAEAEPFVAPDDRPLRLLMTEVLLRMGKGDLAMAALTADAFAGSDALDPASQTRLRALLDGMFPVKPNEHGHALLLSHLGAVPPLPDSQRRTMIEIGTTRETVPGQGSTEKLAACCASLGIDFITVDMDPRNTMMAQRMFRRCGYTFRAVTAKGEDFLADWPGQIDYCFLDAYDFDHGMHSELRQSRYESFLGSRIDEAACHQMHYDCAQSLIRKLSPDGLVCFDDTWTDADGRWTAKGTTAMPFLLENGFKVIEARNHAALLGRR